MNKILQIFKLKKLPKDIINFIISFLYYQRDEKYFQDIHHKKTQCYINYLIDSNDISIISITTPTIHLYGENEFQNPKRYIFGYEIDYEDYRKKGRNKGHSKYNNSLLIYIESYFCSCCGNYIQKIESEPYHMKVMCNCNC